jgi:hypothetical protein
LFAADDAFHFIGVVYGWNTQTVNVCGRTVTSKLPWPGQNYPKVHECLIEPIVLKNFTDLEELLHDIQFKTVHL